MDNCRLRIKYLIDKFALLMLKNTDITAVGRGKKIISGIMTDVPSLTIYVKKKVNSNSLSKDRVIPRYFNGVTTDILESPIDKMCTNRRYRTIYGGSAILTAIDDGTAGYMVNNIQNKNDIYILTCNHLVNPEFENKLGEKVYLPQIKEDEDYIYIGKTKKIVNIRKKEPKTKEDFNEVDAALIYLGEDSEKIRWIIAPGLNDKAHTIVRHIPSNKVEPGDKIYKVGAETGFTTGMVTSVDLQLYVPTIEKGEPIYFKNQIRTNMRVMGGDSGALGIKLGDNTVFGLLMSGSSKGSTFNNINIVFKELNVELSK